jgi:metal-dependent hydrolase (beta-lactamase superfamily II)
VLPHNMKGPGIGWDVMAALGLIPVRYDHTGGLAALFDRVARMPLHAQPDLFGKRFTHRENSITSVGSRLEGEAWVRKVALRLSTQPVEILPVVWTTGRTEDCSDG